MKFTPIKAVSVIFSVNLIVIGVAISQIRPSAPDTFNFNQVTIQQPNKDLPKLLQGKPLSLQIDSINLKLPVEDGTYDTDTKKWTLAKDKAHFALITPKPNNIAGNTFIYGHNNRFVFGKLPQITIGDTAIISTDNSLQFVYEFRSQQEVLPDDTSVFNYQGPPILTIQTCSGTWYEKRTLYTFTLKEVQQ